MSERARVIIMGAAGRDFHNFNVYFKNRPQYQVIAFTAAQIPDIAGRRYPPELSGELYPGGIPIHDEESLASLIRQHEIDQVIFSYSDVPHEYVMHKASVAIAAGADFRLMGGKSTMLRSNVPVVSVCAVRTGAGKSQTTRRVLEILEGGSLKAVAVRHPMPYGDLSRQVCQRFETLEDLKKHHCTIEEMEEYEPHIAAGRVVFAGIDYGMILAEAEKEAQVIVWDGGNNDIPFFHPDIHITVADPLRPGHESTYHPGEANARMADAIVINKADTAGPKNVAMLEESLKLLNPEAMIIKADSPITLSRPDEVKGKTVLVIEDGPTLTHGGMEFGAGVLAARQCGAAALIDPRPYAVGSIQEVYKKFPHIGNLLPAMGYSPSQVEELRKTIERTPCDLVVIGTPIDLRRYVSIPKPTVRVAYELRETGSPSLTDALAPILGKAR
jgi:predicted GTPase